MNKKVKITFGVLITVFLLFLLLANTNISTITKSVNSLSLEIVIIAFVLYMLVNLFRTLRFHILLEKEINPRELFSIVCIHNFFVQLLPARTGEFSYIYMLKKRNIALKKNIASIGIARSMDIVIIAVLLMFGLWSLPRSFEELYSAVIGTVLVSTVIIGVLILVVMQPQKVAKAISLLSGKCRKLSLKRLSEKMIQIVYGFQILKSKGNLVLIVGYSLLIWLAMFTMSYVFLRALFPNLTWLNTILIACLPIVISSLPIHGLAGYGTTEVGYLFPLLLFNITAPEAITAGFIIHTLDVLFVVIVGVIGVVLSKRQQEKIK
jgi:glycosyltransferase 2 family protein